MILAGAEEPVGHKGCGGGQRVEADTHRTNLRRIDELKSGVSKTETPPDVSIERGAECNLEIALGLEEILIVAVEGIGG